MSPQGEREVTASMIDVVRHGPIALVTLRRPLNGWLSKETLQAAAAVLARNA